MLSVAQPVEFKRLCLHNTSHNGHELDLDHIFLTRGFKKIKTVPETNGVVTVWVEGDSWDIQLEQNESKRTLALEATPKSAKTIGEQHDSIKVELKAKKVAGLKERERYYATIGLTKQSV